MEKVVIHQVIYLVKLVSTGHDRILQWNGTKMYVKSIDVDIKLIHFTFL